MAQDFIPVLLGSDMNAYGMARSFHEAYGVASVAIGKGRLGATADSKIVSVEVVEPNIEEDEVFCKTLLDFAARYPEDQKLLLVPCGDNYIKLLARNKDKLTRYAFNCVSEELLMKLSLKESFYEVCAENGFAFPQTATVSADAYEDFTPPFEFPIVIKPSNSVAYWNCTFPHKKKVFVANSEDEMKAILKAIYGSSYQDTLIIQEFIPGDDSFMRVVNCYCGTDKKVKMISLGQALLEEHSPEGIGSYAAIIPRRDNELMWHIVTFLENIGYTGFANFDMKYDSRDGRYKLFEINLRQGRSSYFVTAAGQNLAKLLVDDVIYHREQTMKFADSPVLWSIIPKDIIFKYVSDPALVAEAKALIKAGKYSRSLRYAPDLSMKRKTYFWKNQASYRKKYKKYFGNKGLHE